MSKVEGFLSVVGVTLDDGKVISTQRAVDLGWIKPDRNRGAGWGLERHEVPLGRNLFLDDGRQCIAYIFGEKIPVTDFVCRKFGVGVGTTPPNVTNVTLEEPLNFYGGLDVKPVDAVDYPAPFVARVLFTLAAGEANGYLITETGLFSGNETLIARRVHAGINKTSDFAPQLAWRVRF